MLISPGGIVIGFRIFFNLWSTILKVDQYLLLEYLRKKMRVSNFGTVLAVWHVSKGGDLVIE